MPSSVCAYKWKFSNRLELTHICVLKYEHEDEEHYCGQIHNIDNKQVFCASSQFRFKTRVRVSDLKG